MLLKFDREGKVGVAVQKQMADIRSTEENIIASNNSNINEVNFTPTPQLREVFK